MFIVRDVVYSLEFTIYCRFLPMSLKIAASLIPDYENDCRGYPFKIKSSIPVTANLIKEILIFFKNY